MQGDGELIDELSVAYSEEELSGALSRELAFWSGWAAPLPVDQEDYWKCSFCHFQLQCPTGQTARREAPSRQREGER